MLKLRHLLAVSIGALACSLLALALIIVGDAGSQRIEVEIGRSLAQLADQMQDKVDRFLYERLQQIKSSAELVAPLLERHEKVLAEQLINNVKSTHPDFSWIGVVDRDGRTIVASGPNANVKSRSWFVRGFREPSVGEVHTPTLTEKILFVRSRDDAKFIDISAPVTNDKGKVVAVLGGKLTLSWAGEARDALFGLKPQVKTDVIVLSRQGKVIIGPTDSHSEGVPLQQIRRYAASAAPFSRSIWPNGVDYVTGYARSDGYRNFKGIGWIVLVRQSTREALAPVRHLRRTVLAWGLGLAALASLAAWFLSGLISRPMTDLAKAAEDLRDRATATIPSIQTFYEANVLSSSMRSLVRELESRRVALENINTTLERQVFERTRELEKRNRALDKAREEAVSATKSKSRFIAAASHDLRQPLHAMSLLARALSRRVPAGDSAELVSQLESSLKALRRMFDSLLDVSRLDSGLIQPQIEPVSAKGLIDRIATDGSVDAGTRGLRFRTHATDLILNTDPVILESMVRNLVANALKFTKSGGVLLAVRRREGRTGFEIYDTGPGIPAEWLDRIFVEFDRAREHATGPNEGLGLGLSIVKRYAELLGIEIAVCSRLGKGTRFSLWLPPHAPLANKHDDVKRGTTTVRETPPNLTGLRVLVIDDDEVVADALRRELADRGCLVSALGSPEQIESYFQQLGKIDVAVVDYHLWQGITGLEFISKLEASSGHPVAALILSGATDPEALNSISSSGRAWLTKPIDPAAIAGKLAELAQRRPKPAPGNSTPEPTDGFADQN